MNNDKKSSGRKKNPDKKIMTGIYNRPSEIAILGGMNEYKRIIYDTLNKALDSIGNQKSVENAS
jgi:hypothetical protein